MKYCSHCGKELYDEAVICTECGCSTENKPQTSSSQSVSVLAIVGFACAFFIPIAGLVCSIIALNKAKSENDLKSKPFALAGVVISAVYLAVMVLTLIIYFGFIFTLIYGISGGGYY